MEEKRQSHVPWQCLKEEVQWGVYTRRGRQPRGDACQACLTITRRAFPLEDWSALTMKMQTSGPFQEEYKRIQEIYEGSRSRDFLSQSYVADQLTGYTVERSFLWQSLSDFEAQHKCSPTDIGLTVETIEVDQGVPQKGILYKPKNEEAPLVVKKFHTVCGKLSDLLLSASEQLREGQGREVAEWHCSSTAKALPSCFSKGQGVTEEEVKSMAQRFAEKEAVRK
eukprot:6475889-Amphidinium_carterae.1